MGVILIVKKKKVPDVTVIVSHIKKQKGIQKINLILWKHYFIVKFFFKKIINLFNRDRKRVRERENTNEGRGRGREGSRLPTERIA